MPNDCVFCRIVSGELSCHKVYEDSDFLGFLSIAPKFPGHCLLVPKKHYRWTYDYPEFGKYWEKARELGEASKMAMGADFVSFLTLGNEVKHAHIWIMPRAFGDKKHGGFIDFSITEKFSQEEMAEIAKKIRECL